MNKLLCVNDFKYMNLNNILEFLMIIEEFQKDYQSLLKIV